MAIELARTMTRPRPWGTADQLPWHKGACSDVLVGEVSYERADAAAPEPSLLLKLLFTSQPLSIQVHPDDAHAQSMGLSNGKTEAWYVLSARPGAKVALGLKLPLTQDQLRKAAENGSISDLIAWQDVSKDDVVSVPAGTIHTIGAGLVIAEVQQRSDATFRLFDHGRQRELHIESAIAVATPGPADVQLPPRRLSDERMLLVAGSHFIFERVDLAPGTAWSLDAGQETWLLVLSGGACAGSIDVAVGDAIFAQADHVDIRAGERGVAALVAYTGASPTPMLLQRVGGLVSEAGRRPVTSKAPPPFLTRTAVTRALAGLGAGNQRMEVIQ